MLKAATHVLQLTCLIRCTCRPLSRKEFQQQRKQQAAAKRTAAAANKKRKQRDSDSADEEPTELTWAQKIKAQQRANRFAE